MPAPSRTLQELIAPSVVAFYNSTWNYIDEKHKSLSQIYEVTGIPEYVLATGDLSRASVAQKMSWASRRKTSRVEDIAYSLLGIFNVYMPMLYGEKENAFLRLQEEIIRTTSDDSIFAWTAPKGSLSTYRGLLARSPREFRDSHLVRRGQGTFASSNMGLRVEMGVRPLTYEQREDGLFLGLLNSLWGGETTIAVLLRQLDTNKFARVSADQLENSSAQEHDSELYIPTTLYVEHIIQIPPHFRSRAIHAICFRRGSSEYPVPSYAICAMRPGQLSTQDSTSILIPRNVTHWRNDFRVLPNEDIFLACVKLTHEDWLRGDFPLCLPRTLMVGYNLQTGQYWCRVLGQHKWPDVSAPVELWRAALDNQRVLQDGDADALISTDTPGIRKIRVKITPGLDRDQICLMVDIDGLSLSSKTSRAVT